MPAVLISISLFSFLSSFFFLTSNLSLSSLLSSPLLLSSLLLHFLNFSPLLFSFLFLFLSSFPLFSSFLFSFSFWQVDPQPGRNNTTTLSPEEQSTDKILRALTYVKWASVSSPGCSEGKGNIFKIKLDSTNFFNPLFSSYSKLYSTSYLYSALLSSTLFYLSQDWCGFLRSKIHQHNQLMI